MTLAISSHSPPDLHPDRAAAILRGGARGLEIVIDGRASIDAIIDAIAGRIAEAPNFFRGNDVRVRVEDGPLPLGALGRLDELARGCELRIVEVVAAKPDRRGDDREPVPRPVPLAVGSAPAEPPPLVTAIPSDIAILYGTPVDIPGPVSPPPPVAVSEPRPQFPAARVFVGPVRSGVILEHRGHLVVFGDVNPGAEVRAEGNIVVLGRLRGTAHAAIGRDHDGFILALRLEPQQLRIGRTVARANDNDTAALHPEIAHIQSGAIVVERYLGRLPAGLTISTSTSSTG